MNKPAFLLRTANLLDSLSATELLISDFLKQKKKRAIIYSLAAIVLFIAYYSMKKADMNNIINQKKETELKTFIHSELWNKKAQVAFLKTNQFKDEALGKLLPLLMTVVKNNNLLSAFIVDAKTKRILAHNDPKFIDTEYPLPKDIMLSLMENKKIEIGNDPTGEVINTDISMFIYNTDNSFILRTYGAIPYGKARREIGVFVIESSYNVTNDLVNDQKKFLPLVFILFVLAVPAILLAEYYIRVRMIKEEMLGYDERFIGPYKNIKSLGEGSMGVVYRATRILKGKGVGRQVALKVINKNLYNKKGFLKRFKNEAQMVARLGVHRNIVGLFDFGQVKIEGNESFGLEMPFIDGITLERIIEKYNNDITVGQVLYVCQEILNGLHHAHTLKGENGSIIPIIHRDISPKNILLAFNGSILITDFGIAKSHDVASMTLAGELLGTFTNMSPEQANGEHVDCRSDIFSLGTVLYELMLKKKLYQADDIRILWNLVSKAEIPEITGINDELKRILLKALAKNPSDRYQTALDMMSDIKEVINKNYQEYHFDEKDMESFLSNKH